jgi:hypothetical protein
VSTGPFDSEAEVRALPAVTAAFEASRKAPKPSVLTEHALTILAVALGTADVELGDYDQRIVDLLARGEIQTAAVIASWIERAYQNGLRDGHE